MSMGVVEGFLSAFQSVSLFLCRLPGTSPVGKGCERWPVPAMFTATNYPEVLAKVVFPLATTVTGSVACDVADRAASSLFSTVVFVRN